MRAILAERTSGPEPVHTDISGDRTADQFPDVYVAEPGAAVDHPGTLSDPFGDTLGAVNELVRVRELLEEGHAFLVIPSEAFAHFYPAGAEQLINAFHTAGFVDVFFESLGDELVAMEYLRLWRENTEKQTWIRSTHPLVVEYCRARHPELLPYLAPVVTPAVALARYLKRVYGPDVQLVYAGLDAPGANGRDEFEAEVSFAQLEQLFHEVGAEPTEQPYLLRVLPPDRRRYLSAAGGLPLPMLDEERVSSLTFRKLRGLHSLDGLARLIEVDGQHLGFIDVLPFEGLLAHPGLGPADELYWRRGLLQLAEPPHADTPVLDIPDDLDLSITYEARPSALPEIKVWEVESILEEVGGTADSDYLRQNSGTYAGYVTLAESLIRSRPELALGLFEMSRKYLRAVRDATHDALTDLYSYRALVDRVREQVGQANRAGTDLAMLFVDLDKFKEINDAYGHPVGNQILREIAQVLQTSVRSTDIAGRFGGDEFVVLLVGSDEQGAVRVAEQIRQRVAEIRVVVPDREIGTTVSVGVAFHSGADRSLLSSDDLFAEADASLYIAKAHGGNRVHPVEREGMSG